jgi:hypothetical protein
MNFISETQNVLTAPVAPAPVLRAMQQPADKRNYFSLPGIIQPPARLIPYRREPGIMHHPQFKPEYIRQQTLSALQTDYRQMLSANRTIPVVDSRCILVWLCYKYAYTTGMGKLGRLIGRDRTTAIHMVTRANNAITTNLTDFIEKLKMVEMQLLNQ